MVNGSDRASGSGPGEVKVYVTRKGFMEVVVEVDVSVASVVG